MIYLDYAATTPIEPEILNSYNELLHKYFANAASSHTLGVIVDSLQNMARQQIADFFDVSNLNVIFTSGASESNNLAIKGTAFNYQKRGKHIITSSVEHKSILESCQQLADTFGFEITYLEPNGNGEITLDSVKKALRPDTILVSLMGVNNEIGAITDIAAIAKYVKQHSQAIVHCDAAQAIAKVKQDYHDVDLITVSAHKLYGLKGSGCLIKKSNVTLMPLISGGGQEFGLRSGTSNWPVNVMLAKTLRLALSSADANYQYVSKLHAMLMEHAAKIPNVIINSPAHGSPYIFNFSIKDKLASTIAQAFEEHEIYISTISACSTHTELPSYVVSHTYRDEDRARSAVRVSISKYTTEAEIQRFNEVLDEVAATLRSAQ